MVRCGILSIDIPLAHTNHAHTSNRHHCSSSQRSGRYLSPRRELVRRQLFVSDRFPLQVTLGYAHVRLLTLCSSGWRSDPSLFDNTTNGDVFWARVSNQSIYSVQNGRAILRGQCCDAPFIHSRLQADKPSGQHLFRSIQ